MAKLKHGTFGPVSGKPVYGKPGSVAPNKCLWTSFNSQAISLP
ncbi:hypothetical protein [Pedobacter sp. MC2016-24]|nr:hypothetical protein [Pedobacter sp. MC2016-24]